ncbi:ferrous iron transport protein B [Anaerosalibacter sp. Marseille-P3206]|uniref:ferrous iron transport protein B n=1 Tax=Anaerosalibacter sp. Marseille-P3206 TaxID=1871005 RepID=UPI00190E77D3|nr:ferrous iron transport protein B [Anaerosalibacter sp. Marseille-P3206]
MKEVDHMAIIALAGNPNCGKTTMFNALTGTRQHVGNWPGVTVEKKEGILKIDGEEHIIVDLPGTYSLGAYSEDEVVARNFIVEEKPDVVINVVDATNLERNLYLTTQLLEMDVNVILALNMIDEVEEKNITIDTKKLAEKLGITIVPTSAAKKTGIDALIKSTINSLDKNIPTNNISYGKDIDEQIEHLTDLLDNYFKETTYPTKWIALKLLEGDEYIYKVVSEKCSPEILKEVDNLVSNGDLSILIVDKRYEFIGNVLSESIKKPNMESETTSDKIDKILTHKWFGLPIFAIIMFIIYQLTFYIGEDILGELVGSGIKLLGENINALLVKANAPELLTAFISDGLIGGVGAVVEFVPLIMVMYIFIGILEDSGYMARAAYVMDNIMRALGLHGKTFISMLIGTGCNVPGVMATRTLDSKKDRMIAMLINPFISCGARLPIYLLFISAFFPKHGGIILFSLYILGFLVAILMGKLFSKTLFKGESSHFIMELPPYRVPSLEGVLLNMWDKVSSFLKRAGTTILAIVTGLWILSVLPLGVTPYSEASVLGKIGAFFAPILKPAGFGTWQATVSLIAGVAAKEAVVATLGMVYVGAKEGANLIGAIQQAFTPLSALSFMIMTLLYTPCAGVIATIKKETNSSKWALFTALYTLLIGWIGAVLVFQIGKLLGFS